jgi:stress-induced morphogen
MATIVKGPEDKVVVALRDALLEYESAYPGSEASLYRQNSASVRLRVIDRRFEGMTKSRRHSEVWDFLACRVSEETLSDISLLLAIAPAELGMSFANFEFESPSPSQL